MKIHIALIALLLFSNTSFASTGNELLSDCNQLTEWAHSRDVGKQALPTFEASRCQGLIIGTVKTAMMINNLADTFNYPKHELFCVPPTATTRQATKVIIKFLEEHPEMLHEDESMLIAIAFRNSFPCK
jgi:hypothetical protein